MTFTFVRSEQSLRMMSLQWVMIFIGFLSSTFAFSPSQPLVLTSLKNVYRLGKQSDEIIMKSARNDYLESLDRKQSFDISNSFDPMGLGDNENPKNELTQTLATPLRYKVDDWFRNVLSLPHSFILQRVSGQVMVFTGWAAFVTYLNYSVGVKWEVASQPHTWMLTAVGLLLVYRTNAAYDRFWEARKLWGSLTNDLRNFARVGMMVLPREAHIMYSKLIMLFPYILMYHLQRRPANIEVIKDILLQEYDPLQKIEILPEIQNRKLEFGTANNKRRFENSITEDKKIPSKENTQVYAPPTTVSSISSNFGAVNTMSTSMDALYSPPSDSNIEETSPSVDMDPVFSQPIFTEEPRDMDYTLSLQRYQEQKEDFNIKTEGTIHHHTYSAASRAYLNKLSNEIVEDANPPAYIATRLTELIDDAFDLVETGIINNNIQRRQSIEDPEKKEAARRDMVYKLEIQQSHHRFFVNKLSSLIDILGACERILLTPVPPSYSRHTSRFISLYMFSLPFVLAPSIHLYTPFIIGLISWAFAGIEEIGHMIEDPFNVVIRQDKGEEVVSLTLDKYVQKHHSDIQRYMQLHPAKVVSNTYVKDMEKFTYSKKKKIKKMRKRKQKKEKIFLFLRGEE